MPTDLHRLQRSQQLFLRLLEELDHPPSAARRKAVAAIEARLREDLPVIESYLPLASARAYVKHRGKVIPAPRVAVNGAKGAPGVRRIAVLRTLKLLGEALGLLAHEKAEPPRGRRRSGESFLDEIGHTFRWFAQRHPLLVTLVVLLLIIVLIWRQSFTLSTRFGAAEIIIHGHTQEDLIGPKAPAS